MGVAKNSKKIPVEPFLADILETHYKIRPEVEYRFTTKRKWRLDLAYPEIKLGVELDGFRFHSSVVSQINDAEKSNFLVAQGWRVLRYPSPRVFDTRICTRIVEQIGRVMHGIEDVDADARVLTEDK